ncbi:hypothetical protein Zmor_010518 [Zophobas morio]|uniref:Uncharacterized protein n=1 Tax=Zophobas morio TaxID=2755281 RepID=A0AA38IR69_9CUCU|nr:hypothetical protein Zmor_010518 [Zophobas morio]
MSRMCKKRLLNSSEERTHRKSSVDRRIERAQPYCLLVGGTWNGTPADSRRCTGNTQGRRFKGQAWNDYPRTLLLQCSFGIRLRQNL